jgi:hypothetical protein
MAVKCTLAKVLIFGTMLKNIVTLLSIFMKTSELMYFFYVEFKNKLEISLSLTVFAVEGGGTIIFWDPVYSLS